MKLQYQRTYSIIRQEAIAMKKTHIFKLLLIIVWLLVIFFFSAENAEKSEQRSDEVIVETVETIRQKELTQSEKETIINKYIVIVRKSAHFFLYFILGILVFFFLKDKWKFTLKTVLITIIFCLIYAITDEVHQLFINGRTARIIDVIIDTCGSSLSSLIIYLIFKLINKIKNKKSTNFVIL